MHGGGLPGRRLPHLRPLLQVLFGGGTLPQRHVPIVVLGREVHRREAAELRGGDVHDDAVEEHPGVVAHDGEGAVAAHNQSSREAQPREHVREHGGADRAAPGEVVLDGVGVEPPKDEEGAAHLQAHVP